jgi:hypothetical protein
VHAGAVRPNSAGRLAVATRSPSGSRGPSGAASSRRARRSTRLVGRVWTYIEVRLLYKDELLASAKVSFIPQGANLRAGFDPDYERTTDSDGRASFSPKTGTIYLIVAHHEEPTESGEGFDSTKYSATLTVFVPELCPCCRN